jgi:hypothetical protein
VASVNITIVLIMSVWCGQRARQSVLRIGIAAGLQQWDPDCYSMRIIVRGMGAVIGAILLELLLRLFCSSPF